MNANNIPKDLLQKVKEYEQIRKKENQLFGELQNDFVKLLINDSIVVQNGLNFEDVYIDSFAIVKEPMGEYRHDGTYLFSIMCGEDSGWGSFYIPLDDKNYLEINYSF